MRRRRKSRGTWFPVLGFPIEGGEGVADSVSGIAGNIAVPADGTTEVLIQPVTFDDPQEDAEATVESQLTEFVGQEYILHSFIGSLLATRSTVSIPGHVSALQPAVLVAAGLFVARSESDTGQTTDSLPIGATSLPKKRENYSPLSGSTIREPWIFRRVWILGRGTKYDAATGNALADTGQGAVSFREGADGADFPCTTAGYSGLYSGPFFKTKTRRRVRQDERLFFSIACCNWPLAREQVVDISTNLEWYLDYRIFGQMVKAHNRSAF